MKFFLHPADFAFAAALAFLGGIFVAGAGWNAKICVLVFSIGSIAVIILKRQIWRESIIGTVIFLLAIFYFNLFFQWRNHAINLPYDTKTTLSAVVIDEPTPTAKTLMLQANAEPPYAGMLTIFAPQDSNARYGDVVRVLGKINPPAAMYESPTIFANNVSVVGHHRGFFLREWLIEVKAAILSHYQELLPADEAALLGGIAFGSRVNFDQATKNAMALSGTTHLVAISGYNITIVIFAVGSVFGALFPRRTTSLLSIVFLILFILMVGFAASGVRAAIMGFIALVAREIGEIFNMRNAVSFAATAMALQNPAILTHDMSFILSFASLLGIVYLGPPIKKLLKQTEPGILDWKENAITTLSAQLAVMPVLIRVFGRFSVVGIIANILVLGTVPLTMFLGAVLAFLGFISQHLAFFAGQIVGFILWYQLFIIRLFASLAVSLPFSFSSDAVTALYYLILTIFALLYARDHGHDQKI